MTTLTQLQTALESRGLILKIFKPELGTRWNAILSTPGAEPVFAGQGTTIEKAVAEALRFFDRELASTTKSSDTRAKFVALRNMVDDATSEEALRAALRAYEETGDHDHGNGPIPTGGACAGGDCLVHNARAALDLFAEDAADRCPGCGCRPGEGRTQGCLHPEGCGYYEGVRA